MFDSIILYPKGGGINLGVLAESLMFYRRVGIVGGQSELRDFVRKLSPYIALSVLQQGIVEFHYRSKLDAVSSGQRYIGVETYSFQVVEAVLDQFQAATIRVFREAAGKQSGQSLLAARQFRSFVKLMTLNPDTAELFSAMGDRSIASKRVSDFLSVVVPEYNQAGPIEFWIEGVPNSFIVNTNLIYDKLNYFYHQRVSPAQSSISSAYILVQLLGLDTELKIASSLDSEMITNDVNTLLHTKRLDEAFVNHGFNAGQIYSFVSLILKDGNGIRAAVNKGSVSFQEVLKLRDRGEKFREWLASEAPSSDLIQAYYRKTVEDTWVEKLPAKAMRWLLFSGAGLAADGIAGGAGLGTVAGLAVGAVDSFLTDKVVKGWKPHHFIHNELLPKLTVSTEK